MTKTLKELKADVKKADANYKVICVGWWFAQVDRDAAREARYAAREALKAALKQGENK
jgi:aspartokinase-like uncharacterized kinase